MSIKVSAALSGGQFMTTEDTLAIFGDTIPAKYYNGSSYTDVEFRYDTTDTLRYISSYYSSDYMVGGRTFLCYTASVSGLSVNPDYITVDLQPSYSIFDTTQLSTAICLSTGAATGANVSTVYQSPAWDWYWSGSATHLENHAVTYPNSPYYAYCDFSKHANQYCTFVEASFRSQSQTSGYSVRATFSGNTAGDGLLRLYLGLPYVDADATGMNGTTGSGSGGSSGDTNINVNVDMSETNEKIDESNGFLSSLVSWVSNFFSNLGDFFIGLFVPSDGFIDNWKDDLASEIADTFSPLDEVDATLDRLKQAFDAAGEGAVNAMEFPAISIPGTEFSTPSVSVPLKPLSDSMIYDKIAKFIDIVATIAVFNMLLTRFKAFLVGEKVVEVEDVD